MFDNAKINDMAAYVELRARLLHFDFGKTKAQERVTAFNAELAQMDIEEAKQAKAYAVWQAQVVMQRSLEGLKKSSDELRRLNEKLALAELAFQQGNGDVMLVANLRSQWAGVYVQMSNLRFDYLMASLILSGNEKATVTTTPEAYILPTFDQSIALALNNSTDLQKSILATRMVSSEVDLAKKINNPEFSLSAYGGHRFFTSVEQQNANTTGDKGWRYGLTAGISGPLSFGTGPEESAANLKVAESKQGEVVTRNQVMLDMAFAYIRLAELNLRVQAQTKVVALAKLVFENRQAEVAQAGTPFFKLSEQEGVTQAETWLQQLQQELDVAKVDYCRLAHIPAGTNLQIPDDPEFLTKLPGLLKDILTKAGYDPQAIIALYQIQAARALADEKVADRNNGARWQFGLSRDQATRDNSIFFGISIPLGGNKSKKVQATSDQSFATSMVTGLEAQFKTRQDATRQEYILVMQQSELAKKRVEYAVKDLAAAQTDFKAGKITESELHFVAQQLEARKTELTFFFGASGPGIPPNGPVWRESQPGDRTPDHDYSGPGSA